MFVFEAKKILLRKGTRFSNSNMQSSLSRDGETETFFSQIDFEKVYHEGPTGQDRSITACRCAEVLAESPLEIFDALQWVYCRSQAERAMLLHLLGEDAKIWQSKLRVSDDINVFEKRFVFTNQINLKNDGLLVNLNSRSDGQTVNVQVKVSDQRGNTRIEYGPNLLPSTPSNGGFWFFKALIEPGIYHVQIYLEGHRAFQADLLYDDIPF